VILIAVVFARLSLHTWLYRWRYLGLCLPVIFGVHMLFSSAGDGGIITRLLIALRWTLGVANLVGWCAFAARWIDPAALPDAIHQLLRPLAKRGLPVEDGFQVLFIALRFGPLVLAEYQRLSTAWLLLVGRPANRLVDRLERLRASVPALILFSLHKSETLAASMMVRGYGVVRSRTCYTDRRLSRADWIGLTGAFALLAGWWL